MALLRVGTENATPIELYYEDHGTGKPVVLIHGWPLSGRSWEPQVPALVAAGQRVITYDRRGFGSSSQPWQGYEYDTLAADLHTLIEHLDLREATLVGFSMGGGEVVRYLSRYGSGRIAAAVLAAAVPPYLYASEDNPDGGLDDATIHQFRGGVRVDRPAFLDTFTTDFYSANEQLLVSEAQRQYAAQIAAFASPKGTFDCIDAFGMTDFRTELDSIDVPTLIMHGDSDAIVPFEVSGKRSHQAIAGSRLALLEGAPHGCNVTHPERFNSALLDFLAR